MPIKFNADKPIVDIIIPTYENHHFLAQTVKSILQFTNLPYRIFVVNNSERELSVDIVDLFGRNISDLFKQEGYECYFLNKIELGENKGWMGGINAGINHIKNNEGGLSKYVLFLNDDIQIVDQMYSWLANMVNVMEYYHEVGAVGPISNAVMLRQHIQMTDARPYHEESVLSGFCFLVRSSVIDEVGVLDESLIGGDDVDYSIRIKDAGHRLVCCRRSFVYHYYAQTGRRLHKEWDNRDHSEKIARDIIRKHGLRKYLETMNPPASDWSKHSVVDIESAYLRTLIPNNGAKILDMGCGNGKIYPHATGVDMTPNGEYGIGGGMRFQPNRMTDIVADISEPLPMFENEYADYILGKHVLEHIVDHISTLKEWNRILKKGGKLVLAVPDMELGEALTCDPTHVHVFNKNSLESSLEMTGYKVVNQTGLNGAFSLITVAEKI